MVSIAIGMDGTYVGATPAYGKATFKARMEREIAQVKQRLCASGMRWKEKGASVVLSLRGLIRSTGRWQQFWGKINQYGFPVLG